MRQKQGSPQDRGEKPVGGGGAPPTTLILLRNQRPRVARPRARRVGRQLVMEVGQLRGGQHWLDTLVGHLGYRRRSRHSV